jgi:hypothetical protein
MHEALIDVSLENWRSCRRSKPAFQHVIGFTVTVWIASLPERWLA